QLVDVGEGEQVVEPGGQVGGRGQQRPHRPVLRGEPVLVDPDAAAQHRCRAVGRPSRPALGLSSRRQAYPPAPRSAPPSAPPSASAPASAPPSAPPSASAPRSAPPSAPPSASAPRSAPPSAPPSASAPRSA